MQENDIHEEAPGRQLTPSHHRPFVLLPSSGEGGGGTRLFCGVPEGAWPEKIPENTGELERSQEEERKDGAPPPRSSSTNTHTHTLSSLKHQPEPEPLLVQQDSCQRWFRSAPVWMGRGEGGRQQNIWEPQTSRSILDIKLECWKKSADSADVAGLNGSSSSEPTGHVG